MTPAAVEKVVVAVRADKVVSKRALAWALTHVVQPGDCITLLAVFSSKAPGRRLWSFAKFRRGNVKSEQNQILDRVSQISESCSQMVLQFRNQADVRVRIKVVSDHPSGAVAAEANSNGVNWVILDKHLKPELKHCMEELRCSIVQMKGSQAKVLRLNLGCGNEVQTPFYSAASSPILENKKLLGYRMKHSTPVSSPESSSPSRTTTRTAEEGSSSSFDSAPSIIYLCERNPLFEGQRKGNFSPYYAKNELNYPLAAVESYGENVINLSKPPTSSLAANHKNVFWIPQNHIVDKMPCTFRNNQKFLPTNEPFSASVLNKLVKYDHAKRNDLAWHSQAHQQDRIVSSNIRDVVSINKASSMPPPLCSLCQHKTPAFGKPPRRFSYQELEEATNGFSGTNFLAEGGFGVVHRGILRDGQVVAVKQLKFGGAQGDADFCREVRVLSCAQHRNVVLLIGFCIEANKRVLVYEYICNGSLDFHLHKCKTISLHWESRLKIAVGAARGLRYLHEDCRVGCIVHRDMRPNNILLTHDFEPLVADFGLARWYSEADMNPDEQVIGTTGYLAPEYIDGGKITQKVDVYAFGVVLLELMTGRRSSDLQSYKGQILLPDLSHPFSGFESLKYNADFLHFLDPCLVATQSPDFCHQVQAMIHAASLCLQRDPDSRPPMSKILRILEGGEAIIPLALDMNPAGSRSGHLGGLNYRPYSEGRRSHSRKLSH